MGSGDGQVLTRYSGEAWQGSSQSWQGSSQAW
jgi:hypothetical protein